MQDWWNTLHPGTRRSMLAGCVVLASAVAVLGWWLLHPAQAVLFSGLSPQDAGVLARELDRQKLPYRIADEGSTLLVDEAQVHATRLRLMGKDLPLHGAVGFELFNGSEIGMSEFAQKVHWQRALQGELTRTILAFPEVRLARVHLALPEQGLFRQATQAPKAAVTVGLRPGRSLRPEQVLGIQRLLAAAVPALQVHDVTVLDEQGVALSRVGRLDGEGAASALLDLKRETESYLVRKAMLVLDRSVGPGQALASVDVVLAPDQVRTTTEDVLPAAGSARGLAAGVLVRERESLREAAMDGRAELRSEGRAPASSQRDAEYRAGRRVEQVVSQPGAIRRLHLVAVVQQSLEPGRAEDLRQLLAVAVGAVPERGDQVRVQVALPGPGAAGGAASEPAAPEASLALSPLPSAARPVVHAGWLAVLDAVAIAAAFGAAALAVGARLRRQSLRLSPPQRQLALGQVQAWLDEGTAGSAAAGDVPHAPGAVPTAGRETLGRRS